MSQENPKNPDLEVASKPSDALREDAPIASNESENTSEDAQVQEELASHRLVGLFIGSALFLAIATLVIIIVMPPLSWTPEKEVQSNFRAVATLENLNPGNQPQYLLRYHTIEKDVVYAIQIEQESTYKSGKARVSIQADVTLSRPERRDTDDTIAITLSNVEVHAYDGDSEIQLASAGAMIAGISLFARLDAQTGIGTIVPDANINPQVARVLYIVSDVLRQVWIPLPSEKIDVNASWTVRDLGQNDYVRTSNVRVTQASQRAQTLEMTPDLMAKRADTLQSVGSGKSIIERVEDAVTEATIDYARTQPVFEGGATSQTTHATLRRR